ncbi:MAG: hypothetical protein ABIQ04_04480 [Candidatus Saccharimonadales bacterium]
MDPGFLILIIVLVVVVIAIVAAALLHVPPPSKPGSTPDEIIRRRTEELKARADEPNLTLTSGLVPLINEMCPLVAEELELQSYPNSLPNFRRITIKGKAFISWALASNSGISIMTDGNLVCGEIDAVSYVPHEDGSKTGAHLAIGLARDLAKMLPDKDRAEYEAEIAELVEAWEASVKAAT